VQSAVNRRGRQIECIVDVSALKSAEGAKGVILIMDAAAQGPAKGDESEAASLTSRAAADGAKAAADGARVDGQSSGTESTAEG
jgi:hypothetical protein